MDPTRPRRNLAVDATRAVFCLVSEAYRDGGVVSPCPGFPRRVDGFGVWRRSPVEEAPHGDIGGAS